MNYMIERSPYIDLLSGIIMSKTTEAKKTIDELLRLIESSDGESLKMSNGYLYNVLSTIRKEIK